MIHRTTRREFLYTTAWTGAALGFGGLLSPLTGTVLASETPDSQLKVLVLGGTGQTGPHLIRKLLERGHTVTMFNRGNRSGDLFPDVECLIGDRALDAEDGLKALRAEVEAGRTWDIAMDIWPQVPQMVEDTGRLLRESVGRYMFVSSISVYADFSQPGADETCPLNELPDPDMEYDDNLFGAFKAECEKRVRGLYPENHTIYRPGLIVGPRDSSNRGVYWPVRVREGGEVLAPGDGSDPVQLIDGRDLAAFEARCMERGTGGTFNVTGPHPDRPLTMKGLLEACREASDADATFVWADAGFLGEQEIGPWMDMPCWIPAEGAYAGFGSRGVSRALEAGLVYRPLVETLRDTLDWYDGLPQDKRETVVGRAGLSREREAAALAAWHAARD